MHGLRDLRVVDFSTGIAGGYCTKLLADAGADVIKVEDAAGDSLRRWSATGAELGDELLRLAVVDAHEDIAVAVLRSREDYVDAAIIPTQN